ncbi:MAG: AAA family ATPase [Candidatus Cyclonatronum sp.]|uniref:McrB family protein n=1 Tax=Cyclonatronum sp. TaxID=3024185 RepID=UPI0025BDD81B|nr:AAA family ATPase [Cyclonatronum sp.]MCH8487264.1 AAA family ATPase [Cyclonatronum sp.]
MPFEPENITQEHVNKALELIKKEGYDLRASTGYDVIVDGKAYPPKEIMRYAHEQMNGERIWNLGGGEPTNRYLKQLGYQIRDKTEVPVQAALIEKYKELIRDDGNSGELFKWHLIKRFQEQWDINAPDFAAMINRIDFSHLIDHRSRSFIKSASEYPEELREAFRMLYDESLDLNGRIREFGEKAGELMKRTNHGLKAHQDERTVATYLTFRYPDVYTFYKYSFYSRFTGLLGISAAPAGSRYSHYLSLIMDLAENFIPKDSELIQLSRATLNEDCFEDKNLNILAQDIIYRALETDEVTEKAFTETLEAIGFENAADYFRLLGKLVSDLDLAEKDLRVHFGVPAVHKRLSFVTGQRYCFTVSANDSKQFGFIYPESGSDAGDFAPFNGEPEAYWHETDLFSHAKKAYDKIRLSCISELRRTRKSSYRSFTNGTFEKTVFDSDFRNEIFMKTFGRQPDMGVDMKLTPSAQRKSYPLNQILFGPPGTGKTFSTVNKALQITDPAFYEEHHHDRRALTKRYAELLITDWDSTAGKKIAFVTFHQSFTYEDFVEGIKPAEKEGKLSYTIESGVFKRICEEAKGGNCVLIIDEINRGNIAQIFGELITLLEPDKREGGEEELRVILPYSKKEFSVPSTLYIIGTMNTADRSVEALDTALRRRFAFEELPPRPHIILSEGAAKENGGTVLVGETGIRLDELLKTINSRIERLLGKDHLIGHSYFMKVSSAGDLQAVFHRNILPLLEEYFYGDKGKIQLVLGRGFVLRQENDASCQFARSDYDDSVFDDRDVWKLTSSWQESEDDFEDALLKLLNRAG